MEELFVATRAVAPNSVHAQHHEANKQKGATCCDFTTEGVQPTVGVPHRTPVHCGRSCLTDERSNHRGEHHENDMSHAEKQGSDPPARASRHARPTGTGAKQKATY